ncbi:hypothetical protein EDC14_1015120 [Hydrogenispora ethanolica]|uniref:Uncharacterized protein n=1 Tax=Hydrogenispora ethanolica TaxID=1082276 RepID=A0A4V2QE46_HYDET|nr:hypothetical protein [Hydrogenispora ethanolica]TCL66577.1 hypothetical protein EDC14_1015120 [Hydrogenispora ethanolica]
MLRKLSRNDYCQPFFDLYSKSKGLQNVTSRFGKQYRCFPLKTSAKFGFLIWVESPGKLGLDSGLNVLAADLRPVGFTNGHLWQP